MSADTYVGDPGPTETALIPLPRGSARAAVAASASLVAAAVHVLVAPQHLRDGWLPASFLAAVALAQVLLAWAVLRRPTVAAVVLGLVGTVGVVLAYVASRTVGVPLFSADAPAGHGAHGGGMVVHQPIPGTVGPGTPVMPGFEGNPAVQSVGALDLIALIAELGVVVALLGMLPLRQRGVVANVLLVLGASLWTGALLVGGGA